MLLTDDYLRQVLEAVEKGPGLFDYDAPEPFELDSLDPISRLTEEGSEEAPAVQPLEPMQIALPKLDTRQITEVPAQERAVVQHGVEPTFRPGRWMKDYDNGHIPISAMKQVAPGHYARPDVARAFKAMKRAMRKDGLSLSITDSYRSYDEQVELKSRKPTLAATPGHSNHGWGIAFDINVNDPKVYQWLRKNGEKFGFNQPMSYEPWHWEYEGGYKPSGKPRPQRPSRVDRSAPSQGRNNITSSALVTAPTVFGSVMAEIENPERFVKEPEGAKGLGFVPKRFRNLFVEAGNEYGIAPRLLAAIAQHESGFDPKAVSSAGAQGLMQIMPLHNLSTPFNARANVMKGAAIFASYLERANGNLATALAYYNAGPNADESVIQERIRLYAQPILDLFRGRG